MWRRVPASCGISVTTALPACEKDVKAAARAAAARTLKTDVGHATGDPGLGFGVRPGAREARERSRLAVPASGGAAPNGGLHSHARQRAGGGPRAARTGRVGVHRA